MPLGLRRLYIGSLAGFAARKSGEVTKRLQAVLQERLSLEPDADLRAALRRTLSGK